MVLRLAENGCLLKFLQKSRDNPHVNVNQPQICFTRGERIRIARDIANGMLHLSNKRVRSARNREIWTVRIILYSRSRCTRYIRRILCSDWPAILADQVGVSCPLTRFVNARKYLVQACGSFPISTQLDLSPGKYRKVSHIYCTFLSLSQ